ncbi:MAG: hypothetical protein JXA54_14955 [Candidatus Heimdallarchaeota archaeon]|nr:hypothetical protein [Candidatus Heimdallarchaeota archaeon]
MLNKKSMLKISLMTILTAVMVLSSLSIVQLKATTVGSADVILTKTTYGSAFYTEGIQIFPLRNESVGVHVGFIGGSVELPFDVTETQYNNLQALIFTVSNQKLWNSFATKRFWDVADGATLMLGFLGDPNVALDLGRSIELMIESAYNFSLTLVYGRWDSTQHTTILVYQGLLQAKSFEDFTNIYPNYIDDEGFGEGITATTLTNAPVKAMGFSLYRGAVFRSILSNELRGLFPTVGLASTFIPIIECGWINPNALVKTDSIIEMNLTTILPDLSIIESHPDSKISIISMKLPYVVDVLVIDPKPDNMYSHLKGEFEWIIKLDIPILNVNYEQSYEEIYVKYDLNITGLTRYPKVIGEMSLANTLPINGGEDIIYEFSFENVGNEPAYDINLSYGEFNLNQTSGTPIYLNNPELTFDPNHVVYYNTSSYILTDTPVPIDDEIIAITGWFYNTTSSDWLRNNAIVLPEEFENPEGIIYVEEYFLSLDPMDFSYKNITNNDGTITSKVSLNAVIPVLNPGENITLQFAVRNLPMGTFTEYQLVENDPNNIELSIKNTYDWEDLIVTILQLFGSTLHFPEDQVTWTNWFPQPVVGATFFYNDAIGKDYLGITNGLVIQVYDDEAVLICKLALDQDIYRFDEEITFSLEFTNIGNANATNIQYQLFHGYVDEDYNMRYVQAIIDTNGEIELIKPGQTVIVEETALARAEVGIHPVFAVFGYTSNETTDLVNPIFSSVRHPAVFSSLDFGIVLPPIDKEGTTEPTYPTPEVEVTTEVLGYRENETTIGDIITLRTTITNTGDEATNIIYLQRIPRRLAYVENTLSITVDSEPVIDYELEWFAYQPDITRPRYNPYMPIVRIYGDRENDGQLIGIPLNVGETLVIEADFTILRSRGIEYIDWESLDINNLIGIYIPPAEVRYNSNYNMIRTSGVNENVEIPNQEEASTSTSSSITTLQNIHVLTINTEPDIGDKWVSTNSWGSYSDSLSLVFYELLGLGNKAYYYGAGIIAVTSVAILIYFKANGKRK